MAASSSTFTAANPTINYCYDVFLNHRGPDVKKTFAKSLYRRLENEGLRAFLDQDELQTGYHFPSQIIKAIQTATLHVAIFSPRYAESDWCLRELVTMVKSKAPIIPVFYLVKIREVRWIEGKYAQDLQNLAEKKTQEGKPRNEYKSIEDWRAALSLVADYKGFELKVCNGEELQLELLDELVKDIKGMLETLKKPDLHVATYPTGLDEKLKHFEDTVSLQKQPTGKPQILGIVGLGGVGKTTLAKEFFNRKNSISRKSCFLSNVRETSLTSLQQKLLQSLTSIDEPIYIDSVDEGKAMLRKHLKFSNSSKSLDDVEKKACNALIILDDVDGSHQLDALLLDDLSSGSLKLISSDSLILITCRDKHVLRRSRVKESSIYTLTGLDYKHSQELFCSYAFSQLYPLPGFKDIVDCFLEACKGLPLSLKVFGANLYGRDIDYWKDQLRDFPSEIRERLQISYNALDREEQQIFLDTACFFQGLNRDTAITIWNESGWKGRWGFQNLQDKCLVEVDSSSNEIQMHDHVRDMGRYVAEKKHPHRLLRWGENVIADLPSSPIIARGLKMDVSEYKDYSDELGRICTRRLKILDTQDSVLEHILRRAELPRLLWLRWMDCPFSSLPSWIPMESLRYLEVSGSVLNTLWERTSESQESLKLPVFLEVLITINCVTLKNITGLEQLTKLRQLSFAGCSELEELPSIETLVYLEGLWAHRCVKLKRIPGLGMCTRLRKLSVEGCSRLEELPGIETLVSLEELWAIRCVKLKSIMGLEQLTKLRKLFLSKCYVLEELPSVETLVSLEALRVDECMQLKSIQGLAKCTQLQMLDVRGLSKLKELAGLKTLVSLKELWASGCVQLKSITGLEQSTKLQKLVIFDCYELEELPSIGKLVSLEEEFLASECVKLKRIRLAGCTRLRRLFLSGCSSLEELPGIETLVSLEELEASRCKVLKSIRLTGCTRLRRLFLRGCCYLEELELPGIETLVSLEELSLEELEASSCGRLKSITGLEQLTKLSKLYLDKCSDLKELPSVETLVSLKTLRLNECVQLKSIQGLAQCTQLQKLNVSGLSKLEELAGLKTLESLEELGASRCVQLKSLTGLEQLTKLKKLVVYDCYELEELPSIETLESLEGLWAGGCVKLKLIRGLAQCTRLRWLFLDGCYGLEELPSVETLVSLEELRVDKCVQLKSIQGLAQCRQLQMLDVSGLSKLEELAGLKTLVSLKELRASGCVQLKSITGLEQLTELQKLIVFNCDELEELPSIKTLVCLEELRAGGCVKLKRIRGLAQLRKLRVLDVKGCAELEEVEGVKHCRWLESLNVSGCPKLGAGTM